MREKHRTLRTKKREAPTKRKSTLTYNWSDKHKDYIRACADNVYNFAEGAVRAGKTVDNVYAFAHELKTHPSKFHLASGATSGNAKLNIGECNEMGLEAIFRGQCHWGKYRDNDALIIKGPDTNFAEKVVIFVGGGKADSFKKIRGNTYGMWIATEINNHHDTFIKEAFNRTLASKRRKYFWDLNPDHPKHPIYVQYIDDYVEKNKKGKMPGGVNFQKFTIFDNVNIPKENLESILAQYVPGSIWHNRDILGQRCIAEGLIYKKLAAEFSLPNREQQEHALTKAQAKKMVFDKIVVAIDFGGTGSGHALVATGITADQMYRQKLVALKSRRYMEGGTDPDTGEELKDIDSVLLGRLFVRFCEDILDTYGFISKTYGDSAEQVLIRSLKHAMNRAMLGHIAPTDSRKMPINDRIFCLDSLSAQGRFYYVDEECQSLKDAISTAIWDPKQPTANIRLDNGTSDIDSMDAFEYTFERDITKLIQKGGDGK